MEKTKLTVSARINADTNKVWDYWTKPEHITKWNFASDDWHCPKAENDLRPGGKLVSRMEAKDGSFGFDFEGTYDEVVDQQKIVYTIADGRQVNTTFESRGGEMEVITVFEAESQHSLELQQGGWQAILNNFKRYAESQQ